MFLLGIYPEGNMPRDSRKKNILFIVRPLMDITRHIISSELEKAIRLSHKLVTDLYYSRYMFFSSRGLYTVLSTNLMLS